jgi:aromatic-L-amino-acid decarboxylase
VSFRDDGYAAVDWAARYLETVGDLPVLAQVAPGDLSAKLAASPPEEGVPFAAVLHDMDELILPALTHWQHPRFFAYFAVTASEPGILAELLSAATNQVALHWRASPASTELELRVVDWVRQLLGLPDGWHGHIEDTASTSTLAALIAARYVTQRKVVVCSEHAHSSVEKAARMLGLELRKVQVDDELRMRTDVPLDDVACVVATAGTTSFASVDPVRALAERARAAGAWLHVDAAYAGSAWICDEERWSQDGVELADSLVVNPHKWLMLPMDCSLLWTARPEEFRTAFSLVPEYLRTPEDVYALSEYGSRGSSRPWSRRATTGSSSRRSGSRSSSSGSAGATRRTRRSSSARIAAARSSSHTQNWAVATRSGWRSGMRARPKRTCAGHGRC